MVKTNIRSIVVGIFILSVIICMNSCKEAEIQDSEKALVQKVDSVLSLMTLEEKLGQLTLYTSNWDVTGPVMRDDYIEEIKAGRCGNIFNAHTVAYNKSLQKIAIEESRLGIPLLFAYDVIHGHKTIFPTPLAEASSWNMELMEKSARYAAMEAAASGLSWTFGPMVDISRDPRWGRISEGNGEDTYLASLIAIARVKGFQGNDLSDPLTLAACVKHFAAYGAPVAGRDYNTVDMSELAFRQDYLPPYKAGIEAGAVTVMASFNDLFGVPAHANNFLLNEILRDEWGFKGFVVADYTGVEQLIPHGYAANRKHSGELALNAGLDMDMQSGVYIENAEQSLEEGKITEKTIDEAVKRILAIKFRLGLFEDPYRYMDEEREKTVIYSKEIMEHALQSAKESIVLLKNEAKSGRKILPLKNPTRIAVIGPLADNQMDMLGSWHGAGDHNKVITVLEGIRSRFPESKINFAEGCDFYSSDKGGFSKAMEAAKNSEVVILAIGENQAQSGEAASRSSLNLTGMQEQLANDLLKTGKPVVILLLAERMLTFPELEKKASTIIYGWHLGTRSGDAIASVLAGDYNPSGKLVMSMPRNVGQIPIYYNYKNTGRPLNEEDKYTTKYLDVENTPLYPFGYGISYTEFDYSEPELSSEIIGMDDTMKIKIKVSNTGNFNGHEIVQLYIRDVLGSVTRPVMELKGFKKVFIEKGKSIEAEFVLSSADLKFIGKDMKEVVEPGDFQLFIGPNSANCKKAAFTLK
jgi:beta-glucosidase